MIEPLRSDEWPAPFFQVRRSSYRLPEGALTAKCVRALLYIVGRIRPQQKMQRRRRRVQEFEDGCASNRWIYRLFRLSPGARPGWD